MTVLADYFSTLTSASSSQRLVGFEHQKLVRCRLTSCATSTLYLLSNMLIYRLTHSFLFKLGALTQTKNTHTHTFTHRSFTASERSQASLCIPCRRNA